MARKLLVSEIKVNSTLPITINVKDNRRTRLTPKRFTSLDEPQPPTIRKIIADGKNASPVDKAE
jgi:hypothetical protein